MVIYLLVLIVLAQPKEGMMPSLILFGSHVFQGAGDGASQGAE